MTLAHFVNIVWPMGALRISSFLDYNDGGRTFARQIKWDGKTDENKLIFLVFNCATLKSYRATEIRSSSQ